MTTTNEHDWDGCLMCAVRALTEERPREWSLRPVGQEFEPGESVTGVVLRQGEQPSHFESRVPFMDLWLGGVERARVAGHGMSLREAMLAAEIQVGDTVTVTFEKETEIQSGKYKGKPFKLFTVAVKRGHH